MKLLKFGGTSLANAEKFLYVANILEKNINTKKVSAVLSAPAKVTNYFVKSIENLLENNKSIENINHAEYIFMQLINDIALIQPNFCYKKIHILIQKKFHYIKKLIHGILLLKQCPDNIHAIIISSGEILSVLIMKYILKARNYRINIIDPIENLVSIGNYLNSTVNILESQKNIQKINLDNIDVILMAGFIAGNHKKELVVLGRNGSDYSAAVLAVCIRASFCEIWTDVDGFFTSDPKEVADAALLKTISYQEAMELSYFGAKVLHPRTIEPLSQFQIPCIIKNTNNINAPGTLISNTNNQKEEFLKGITHLDNIAMFSISGIGIKNTISLISRIFTSILQKNIKIILITQSSSNNNINFCIFQDDINLVKNVLHEEFKLEIKEKILNPIQIIHQLSIISIIGSNIREKYNIASKIFSVLGFAKINVLAIAHGSSENTISLVIHQKHTLNSINIIHDILFSKKKIINIFLIGIGGVGKALIQQIIKQKTFLNKKNIHIKICIIANSKKCLILKNEINIKDWKKYFKESSETFNLDKLMSLIKKENFVHPVLVDCTSDQILSEKYIDFLNNGFHIVTSNKKANTNSLKYYNHLRDTILKTNKHFFYETNVGAGLPIISTLKNLLNTGDKIIQCTGILSGSLSFIFGKLEEGVLFSQATKEAKELGFTEPHPYEDLSGIDVARKLLILSRELGYKKELHDIIIKPILPEKFIKYKNIDHFLLKLEEIDKYFIKKVQEARSRGNVLRFVGNITNEGKSTVKIQEISIDDPLYKVKNGENVLAFYSKNYQPIPLVLKGYGAGNNVTASGVFADLLSTLS